MGSQQDTHVTTWNIVVLFATCQFFVLFGEE